MKNSIYKSIIFYTFSFLVLNNCFSQSGNLDTSAIFLSSPDYDYKNPQFDKSGSSINYSIKDCMLAYEKWSSAASSIIAVRFMKYNSLSPEIDLTDNTSLNINPAVAYSVGQQSQPEMSPGAVVFQSNRNGNWDIYFSYFNSTAWSNPVAVASDSADETEPCIVPYISGNVLNFLIAYKKGNDIFLKNYFNNTWMDEVNITMNDSLNCSSPSLTRSVYFSSNFYLAYQRAVNATTNSVMFHSFTINTNGIFNAGTGTVLSQPNSQDNIRFSNSVNFSALNYDYEISGTKHFYTAFLNGSSFSFVDQTSDFTSNNFGGTGSSHGDITDSPNGFTFYTWIRRTSDSTQIVITPGYGFNQTRNFYVGDANANTFVNSSTKLVFGPPYTQFRIRFLWEKQINGRTALIESFRDANLTSAASSSNIVPEKFSLSQNYPNPFNPTTVINYELRVTSYVSLKVYDALGKLVAALVNEEQNAGSYNFQFSTSNYQLPSGIYFYKLEAGDFVETRRMILLK